MDKESQKKLQLAYYKRLEEVRRLKRDEEDSHLNSGRADGAHLKKKFQGLDKIMWKLKRKRHRE
jgi:hypothetical protein